MFDIHGFDAGLLDVEPLRGMVDGNEVDGWQATTVVDNERRLVLRLDPDDPDSFPVLKIKVFRDNPAGAGRTHAILRALHEDIGVGIAARPFIADAASGILITEWIPGNPLTAPPSPDDEEMWHRIMAVMGVPKNLPFGKFASRISMRGTGVQQPEDVLRKIDAALAALDESHEDYATLVTLANRAHDKTTPRWNVMPPVALSRMDPDITHYIWDGNHLRETGFSSADWADVAYDMAQMAAHPGYEDLPGSHWVWFRWEYARLTHDEGSIARATAYTNLLYVYWAIALTTLALQADDEKQRRKLVNQRDRYLKKAQRAF